MCLAIEEMRNDAMAEGREEGRAEGREEGRAEGREEGRAEGREEGRAEGVVSTLTALVRDGILTLAQAAERARMTVEAFEEQMTSQEHA